MFLFYRFSCNFGPQDRTNILLKDMQKLLLSTQEKHKQNIHKDRSTKRKGKKALLEFPKSN